MEEIANLLEECKEKIQRIEHETETFTKEYLEEKGEFLKIVRSDFLTGGIIASSLFIIISSLFNFFGIIFPYDLLIGISGFIIGLIILMVPVAKPKLRSSKFNDRIFKIASDFKNDICERVKKIKYDFIRLNRKIDVDKSINIEKQLKKFEDQLYNFYKEGVKGLNQLKEQSPEIIRDKISKINRKYTRKFERVYNSTVYNILYLKYSVIKSLEGESFDKEKRKKLFRQRMNEERRYRRAFRLKLRKDKFT